MRPPGRERFSYSWLLRPVALCGSSHCRCPGPKLAGSSLHQYRLSQRKRRRGANILAVAESRKDTCEVTRFSGCVRLSADRPEDFPGWQPVSDTRARDLCGARRRCHSGAAAFCKIAWCARLGPERSAPCVGSALRVTRMLWSLVPTAGARPSARVGTSHPWRFPKVADGTETEQSVSVSRVTMALAGCCDFGGAGTGATWFPPLSSVLRCDGDTRHHAMD